MFRSSVMLGYAFGVSLFAATAVSRGPVTPRPAAGGTRALRGRP